jgi:eukaryotic-like serine/threonine-protein kinase
MSLSVSQLYEFGKFRLDTQERVLWCEGKLVPLTPKLIDTLVVLVERHGHIVDKQELLERVWPDTFVEEANVTRHVSLLRKTLSEWADTAELIETLPRRGYRFVAPVRQLPAAFAPDPPLAAMVAQLVTTPLATPVGPLAKSPTNSTEELIVETHTITRITAEEETTELDLPATPGRLALSAPVTIPWWRTRRIWVIGAMALVISVVGLWFFLSRRNPALTEKDTLLLADFTNRTGDPVFDGTLRQGLAAQLEQSPFLTFLSDQRVRETLRLMTRSPEERLTPEIGREICLRQGLKAMIRGEIAPLGSHYVITLEAIAGQTGDTLARAQSEAETKEQVLHALSQAASELRRKLGESLSSLQKYAAMLQATTSSLPALQNLSIAMDLNRQGKPLEALPFTQRAVELDPNFANAWITRTAFLTNNQQYKEAAACAMRAYALRARATELERFRIDVWYYQYVTYDLEKTVEVLEQFRRVYPRYGMAHNTLSRAYLSLGQFEAAVPAARTALQQNPASQIYQVNLAETLLFTNQLVESKTVLNKMREAGTLTVRGREFLYLLACLEEDEAAQQRITEELTGYPEEFRIWKWQADRAAYRGQSQLTQANLRKMADLAARPQLHGEAATMLVTSAIDLASLYYAHSPGVAQPAHNIHALTQEALALERNNFTLTHSLIALALNGRWSEAQAITTELQAQYPQDTLLKAVWLPLLQALQSLNSQPAQAIEQLRSAERYEAAAYFLPQYVRGLAWLKLKNGPAATAEFEKIRRHRYFDSTSPLFPLAHLGLARAAALLGDFSQSRQRYQEFFQLWKEADINLPPLHEAKQEFASLR